MFSPAFRYWRRNAAFSARRVLEKLGFVQEGYFREDYYFPMEQRFGDTAVLSLLASAWASRTKP
jgi:RimJ/RimL family protein N-acetyltransferase